jgi:hypothetical protein
MPTTVINLHDTEAVRRAAAEGRYVMVYRPTIYGNPFSHAKGTLAKFKVATREEAIRRYEPWLRAQPDLVALVRRELRGKVLGCWCKPLDCHADILARIADEDD